MIRKIGILILVIFVGIQFIPVAKNSSEYDATKDFIAVTNPPKEVARLLKTSCYDCHSNNTNYPWYNSVAPISWWLEEHIEEAKEELNFSEWATYSVERKDHKLEEIVEEVEEKEMPLKPYVLIHGDAKVSEEQFHELENWINTLRISKE